MITSKLGALDLRSDLTVKDGSVNYFSVSSLEKNIKGEEIKEIKGGGETVKRKGRKIKERKRPGQFPAESHPSQRHTENTKTDT